jgi:transposase InsO family protein
LLHARDRRLVARPALPRERSDRLLRDRGSCERFVPDELHVVDPDSDGAPALTLGTDNGSAFTSRTFRQRLLGRGVRHRRGGYRDPESQALIESWFGKLKEREVWLNEYETLDDARRAIGAYVERYHHHPHSGLNYKTPREVRQTWEDLQNIAA